MKKILLALVVLFVCVAAALGIFIATFDANRYGSVVVQKLSEVIGRPVHLGRLSLVWKNGVALRVQDLVIYADEAKTSKSVEVQDMSAVVRLMPLLHKDVQVSSISIVKPSIHLVKNPDGTVQAAGIPTPGSGKSKSASSQGSLPVLSIRSFTVQDGEVRWEDRSATEPVTISVRDLDVKVKNFSLTRPFAFDVTAAVFSAKQNIHVTGTVLLPDSTQKGHVENVTLTTGLADLDLKELAKASPAVRSLGLEGNIGGKMEVQCQRADFDPNAMKALKASVRLQNAAMKLKSMQSPFENVQLTANVAGGDLNVGNFSANFAKGTLKASADVRQFQTRGISDFKWSAQDLAIDELVPEGKRNAPHLGGRVSLDFSGKASGLKWEEISQTLSGQGRFSLKDGVLLNYNLLREVIEKISIIPGAEGVLQQNLPGIYKAKLGEPSTLFKPIDAAFTVQNGFVVFNNLLLSTDLISLQMSGQVGLLDKGLQSNALLHIEQGLSGVMVQLLSQIDVLRNPQGEIEIPMQIQGQLPVIAVIPDKDFLVQKLMASQAGQLVTTQVRNLLDKSASTGEAGAKNSMEGIFGGKEGLQGLLGQVVAQQNAEEKKQ